MNRRGEPGIGEQPPVPVRGQGRLSPIRGPRLGSRGCNRDLGHGRRGGSRRNYFVRHPTGEEIGDAILRHGPPSSAKCSGGPAMWDDRSPR
ncbi:hypothetical protein BHM03_00017238 [Ensete ventricosum]|nr:hypothetical protein BHM03_00017238 [Ensete ventricosum]